MENRYLTEVLPFLKEIDSDRRKQFEDYFRTAPVWLMDMFALEEMEADVTFVREGAPVDTVYFIGKGLIMATDYRIYGISYDFMLFSKVYAFGGMEVIINLDKYQTTLKTVTKCTVLKIPRAGFKKWIESDITALKQESRLMGEYLLEQAKESRTLLFLQGPNRVAFLLLNRYRQYAEDGVFRMKGDRQKLSDCTGLCVKTISRAVKKFRENDLITVERGYISVNYDQYLRLEEMMSGIFTEEF